MVQTVCEEYKFVCGKFDNLSPLTACPELWEALIRSITSCHTITGYDEEEVRTVEV